MKTAPLVATLLVGASAKMTTLQMQQATEGFIGSSLHYEKLDGFKLCILDDNVKPINNIEQGMSDIETAIESMDIKGVYAAAMELKAGF